MFDGGRGGRCCLTEVLLAFLIRACCHGRLFWLGWCVATTIATMDEGAIIPPEGQLPADVQEVCAVVVGGGWEDGDVGFCYDLLFDNNEHTERR